MRFVQGKSRDTSDGTNASFSSLCIQVGRPLSSRAEIWGLPGRSQTARIACCRRPYAPSGSSASIVLSANSDPAPGQTHFRVEGSQIALYPSNLSPSGHFRERAGHTALFQ